MKRIATGGVALACATMLGAVSIPAATAAEGDKHEVVRSFMSLRECEAYRAKYEGSDSYCAPWKDTSAWALWAVVRSGSSSF